MNETAEGPYVVCADGPDGLIYLDDTGAGVADPADAKRFRSEVDAQAGLRIADLAPTGGVRRWRVARLDAR